MSLSAQRLGIVRGVWLCALWLAVGCVGKSDDLKGACSKDAECPSNQCVESSGVCVPPPVALEGRVLRTEATSPSVRGDVTVRITSVPAGDIAPVTSDLGGAYSFSSLGPSTALEIETSFAQVDPDVTSGLLATRYLAGSARDTSMLDVPAVPYRWLAKIAADCGIFPTLDDAVYDATTGGVNRYFIQRSALVVDVRDTHGSPVVVNRSDVHVALDGYDNFHGNPADATNGTFVCFLEPDAATETWKGVDADTGASGRFVVFRVRNKLGTGVGWAEVTVTTANRGSVNLRSSGSIGVVDVVPSTYVPPAPGSVRFDTDVYPLFTSLECIYCHSPGEAGYENAPVRDGFRADYSGTADQVYAVLTGPSATGCSTASPARVCVGDADASFLYLKPRLETGMQMPDHAGVAYAEDTPGMLTLKAWIEGGAPR